MAPRTKLEAIVLALAGLAWLFTAASTVVAHGDFHPIITIRVDRTGFAFTGPNESVNASYSVEYALEAGGVLLDPVEITMRWIHVPPEVQSDVHPDRFVVEPEAGRSSWWFFGNLTLRANDLMLAGNSHRLLLFANATESGTVESGYGSAPLDVTMVPIPSLGVAPSTLSVEAFSNASHAELVLINNGNVPLKVRGSVEGAVPAWVVVQLPDDVALAPRMQEGSSVAIHFSWRLTNASTPDGSSTEARLRLRFGATADGPENVVGTTAVAELLITYARAGAEDAESVGHAHALAADGGMVFWSLVVLPILWVRRHR